jgi:uncharacterized repeat protein (TIGR01451 family)
MNSKNLLAALAGVVLLFVFVISMAGAGTGDNRSPRKRQPSPLGFSLPRPVLVLTPGSLTQSGGIASRGSAGSLAGEACVFFTDFEGNNSGWVTTGFWHEVDQPEAIPVLSDHELDDPPNDINPDLVTLPNLDPNGDAFLLKAFSGSKIFWYGVDSNGTFIDSTFNPAIQSSKNGGGSSAKNSGDLISPIIDLAGVTQASLSFKTFWQIEGVDVNVFDLMEVAVSTDNGESFSAIGLINPIDDVNTPSAISYSSGGQNKAPIWVEPLFDLSEYAGQQIRLRFRFDTIDALYNGFQGWGIDDICVSSSGIPAPVLESVVPGCVLLSSIDSTLVRLLGGNFVNGATVTVGDQQVSSVGFVSHNELQINLPTDLGRGTYSVSVTNPDTQSSTLSNAVTVAETCGTLNLTKDDGLSADQSVLPGDQITYEICFDNLANQLKASQVVLTDPVPEGTMFVSATGTHTITGAVVKWPIGTLAAGAGEVCYEMVVTVESDVSTESQIKNTATISGIVGGSTVTTSRSVATKVAHRVTHQFEADPSKDGKVDVLDYHLFSVPILETKSQNIISPSDAGNVKRLYQFDSQEDLDAGTWSYLEYPEVDPFYAGRGYWLVTSKDISAEVSGSPILPYPGNVFVVKVWPGDNVVGYPFPTEEAWANVRVRGEGDTQDFPVASSGNVWVEQVCSGYDAGYFSLDASNPQNPTLEPWTAYWMYNYSDEAAELLFPVPGSGAAVSNARPTSAPGTDSASRPVRRSGLSFVLTDKQTGYKDRTLFLGLDRQAARGPDRFDSHAPPRMSREVPSIFVNHNKWKKRPGRYAFDVRPSGSYPVTFPVTLRVPSRKGPATYHLRWKGQASILSPLRMRLVDDEKGRTVNMRKRNDYTVTVPGGRTSYKITIRIF